MSQCFCVGHTPFGGWSVLSNMWVRRIGFSGKSSSALSHLMAPSPDINPWMWKAEYIFKDQKGSYFAPRLSSSLNSCGI